MKIFKLISVTLLISLFISACSVHKSSNILAVSFSTDARLVYKGNSAAMMSMIGPEGIAIGMAIDEGIAKELEAHLAAQGGSKALLTNCFIEESKRSPTETYSELSIHRIDIVPQDDGFYASIAGSTIHQGRRAPFSAGSRDWGLTGKLTDLKQDPSLIAQLLTKVCQASWQRLVSPQAN